MKKNFLVSAIVTHIPCTPPPPCRRLTFEWQRRILELLSSVPAFPLNSPNIWSEGQTHTTFRPSYTDNTNDLIWNPCVAKELFQMKWKKKTKTGLNWFSFRGVTLGRGHRNQSLVFTLMTVGRYIWHRRCQSPERYTARYKWGR